KTGPISANSSPAAPLLWRRKRPSAFGKKDTPEKPSRWRLFIDLAVPGEAKADFMLNGWLRIWEGNFPKMGGKDFPRLPRFLLTKRKPLVVKATAFSRFSGMICRHT